MTLGSAPWSYFLSHSFFSHLSSTSFSSSCFYVILLGGGRVGLEGAQGHKSLDIERRGTIRWVWNLVFTDWIDLLLELWPMSTCQILR